MQSFQQGPEKEMDMYSQLENAYQQRQAVKQYNQQELQKGQAAYDLSQAQLPEQLAETNLNRLVAEKDIATMPARQQTEQSAYDQKQKFQMTVDAQAALADRSLAPEEKHRLLTNYVNRMSLGRNPSLNDLEAVNRNKVYVEQMLQNPSVADRKLQELQSILSKTQGSEAKSDLQGLKGEQRMSELLIRGEQQLRQGQQRARLAQTKPNYDKNLWGRAMRLQQVYEQTGDPSVLDRANEAYEEAWRLSTITAQAADAKRGDTTVARNEDGTIKVSPGTQIPLEAKPPSNKNTQRKPLSSFGQ